MTTDEGIKLCRNYLFHISWFMQGDYERFLLHQALCDHYGISHEETRKITDNLDKYIGYNYELDITEQDIDNLCFKLDEELKKLGGN